MIVRRTRGHALVCHLLPPRGEGGYLLPGGVQLHRRAGRRQWQYGPELQELEAQLKAQQLYEQMLLATAFACKILLRTSMKTPFISSP